MERSTKPYVAPEVDLQEVKTQNVLCLSGISNEDFTDGGWTWDDEN